MVILHRIVFQQRKQKAGASVQHYIADIRSLAVFCKFGDMEEELIRDQLVEHATHPKIREKLIMYFCTGCGRPTDRTTTGWG